MTTSWQMFQNGLLKFSSNLKQAGMHSIASSGKMSRHDCCAAWTCRFVKWTQKTFVAGGHQAELLPLLERCTREMLEMHGYDDDIRYLRLWLQYVRPQPHTLCGISRL